MGQLIRKDAAADDILDDLKTTRTNAVQRGGQWAKLAEERLGPILGVAAVIAGKLAQAAEALAPLVAAIDVANEAADNLVGQVSDDLWNKLGRPASDPYFAILFPGGIAYYTDGAVDEQPLRMKLLADLLESGIHPKLDGDLTKKAADAIRAEAKELGGAIEAVREPAAQVELLRRTKTALSRAGHVALSNLKRAYLAEGFSEAEIHKVIPDRPTAKSGAKAPAKGEGQPNSPDGTNEPPADPK